MPNALMIKKSRNRNYHLAKQVKRVFHSFANTDEKYNSEPKNEIVSKHQIQSTMSRISKATIPVDMKTFSYNVLFIV